MAEGATFGILGALSAFPRRLAAREVARQGFALRGAAARDLTHMVFGRRLLDRLSPDDLAKRFDAVKTARVTALSENGFRRKLGLLKRPSDAGVSRASLVEQSKLDGRSADLLSLFDAFEADAEPYSFRDVILARKYAKLIGAGTSWADIARSVHRTGNVASLTAVALHSEGGGIFVRDGERLSEIDGQGLLPFEADEDHEGADELFTEAEAAEASGDHAAAAALYGQYLAVVPGDPVAAFNMANALAASGARDEAATAYTRTLKIDPHFAEAWFNYGSLLRETGKPDLARQHFERAMALDPAYADPVYSLAALEYDAGRLHGAPALVALPGLDATSDWRRRHVAPAHRHDAQRRRQRGDSAAPRPTLFDGRPIEVTILLAHGAGAPMDSAAMTAAAATLAGEPARRAGAYGGAPHQRAGAARRTVMPNTSRRSTLAAGGKPYRQQIHGRPRRSWSRRIHAAGRIAGASASAAFPHEQARARLARNTSG